MATASTKYLGQLRCSNIHLQSGTEIFTDAPTDNKGMGSENIQEILIRVANTCPVARSLHPDIEKDLVITFT